MKTRVTYKLVVDIEDTDEPGVDQVQRATDMVTDEPQEFVNMDNSNITITAERVSE